MNHVGKDRFRAFSAGSSPTGAVNPLVLEFLSQQGVSTRGARSKSWNEFAVPDAVEFDCVITVCDSAASEACPVWQGQPVSAHWGLQDPARFMDDADQARQVIRDVYDTLCRRIDLLVEMPVAGLDRHALTTALRDIGQRP